MDNYELLAQLLDDIERELRFMELWEQSPPPADALMSTFPFCYDTLEFPQWLQWVFIPRCMQIVRQQASVPASSDIHPMAEIYLDEMQIKAPMLLALIKRFDELITAWNLPREDMH